MLEILLVDDAAFLLALGETLQAQGHRVVTATDPQSALAALGQRAFDVLICGDQLPRAEGLVLYKRVRRDAPSTRCIVRSPRAAPLIPPGPRTRHPPGAPFPVDQLLSLLAGLDREYLPTTRFGVTRAGTACSGAGAERPGEHRLRQTEPSRPSGPPSARASRPGGIRRAGGTATGPARRLERSGGVVVGEGADETAGFRLAAHGRLLPLPDPASRPAADRRSGRGGLLDQCVFRELSALTPGTVIDGRYTILDRLAQGGMGEVYRVEHLELGKQLALKVMLPELSRDRDFEGRFRCEAIAPSRIGHQNIVDVSDFGRTHDGRFYFAMELLDGRTLSSVVRRGGALEAGRAAAVGLQVARALAAAHAQFIIHRDLKPENIMLLQRPGQPDFVKVLDFGVAKIFTGEAPGCTTAPGMLLGTPQYMSPELARAAPADARSDIYSLGLVLYELLTGRPPFVGPTPTLVMVKHVSEAAPPLRPGPPGEVPEALERLVFRMLEKDPDARPQTMEQVVQVLEGVLAQLQVDLPTPLAPPASASAPVDPAPPLDPVSPGSLPPEPPAGPPLAAPERRGRWPLLLAAATALGLLGGALRHALGPEAPPAAGRPSAAVAPGAGATVTGR